MELVELWHPGWNQNIKVNAGDVQTWLDKGCSYPGAPAAEPVAAEVAPEAALDPAPDAVPDAVPDAPADPERPARGKRASS